MYLKTLSRGGLVTPYQNVVDFVDNCFAILDYIYEYIQRKKINNVREICSIILKRYAPTVDFTCNDHTDWGFKFASKSIINCFFNNMEDIDNESVRQYGVVEFKRLKRQKTSQNLI